MSKTSQVGKKAEELAVKFLRKNRYKILERNFATKTGEIDIICRKGRVIVFVEVRGSSCPDSFSPEESVNKKKIQKIVRTAQIWLALNKMKKFEYRFDLIAVQLNSSPFKVNHYQNFISQ